MVVGLGTLLVAASLCAATAFAAPAPSPADAAATHAYLEAVYQYESALLRDAGATRAAQTDLADALGTECKGVLTGEPSESEAQVNVMMASPRTRGELARASRQRFTIEEELFRLLLESPEHVDAAAFATYVTQVAQLSWSEPRVAEIIHSQGRAQSEFGSSPSGPAVCADMRAWASSGFRTLSPSSREFAATLEATARTGARARQDERGRDVHGAQRLARRFAPSARAVTIGFHERLSGGGAVRTVSFGGTVVCVKGRSAPRLSAGCGGGDAQIITATPARMRSVRLLPSDGRESGAAEISSSPASPTSA